jgi:hypothetical protein
LREVKENTEIIVLRKKIEGVDVVVHDLPPKSCVDGLLGIRSLVGLRLKKRL